jgi:hypothetical protein
MSRAIVPGSPNDPTAQARARAATEERQRRSRAEANRRAAEGRESVGRFFSGIGDFFTTRSPRAENETQRRARVERERQQDRTNRAAMDAQIARDRQTARERAAANLPTAEERAYREARNTRVDRLTPEQRRLIRQGRPDAPAGGTTATAAETTRRSGEPGTPTRASLAAAAAGTSPPATASSGTGNATAASSSSQERTAAERSSDLRANNVTFRSSSTPLVDSAVTNSASSVARMGRDVFNIARFRGNVASSDSVLPNHSFLVTFAPMDWVSSRALREDIHSMLTMRCDNAILPSINLLQEQNIRRYGYGPVENVPYGVNVGDFTLQFIVDKDAAIIDFFEAWLNRIVNRDSYGGADMNSDSDVYLANYKVKPYEIAYKDSYACSSINVFVYDRAQNTVIEYNIYDAFPTGIQSMNMSWSEENSLMKLNVTFSFTDLRIRPKVSAFNQAAGERNGIDTNPLNSLPPVSVVTPAGLPDVPIYDPSSITIPVSELAPLVIGDSGAPRSFGAPGDTGPITATTPEVPTTTIRNAFGSEEIIT